MQLSERTPSHEGTGFSRRAFVRLLIAAGGVAVTSACAPATPVPAGGGAPPGAATAAPAAKAASGPKPGGTLTVATVGDFTDFDPHDLRILNQRIWRVFYNRLIRLDGGQEPKPELAERWEVAPDGTKITLQLRQGVKVHSGSTMTVADVIKTFEKARDPQRGRGLVSITAPIADVRAEGDRTLVITFKAPTPGLFDILDHVSIIDPAVMDDLKTNASGTGPFRLDAWRPGDRLNATKFVDYWDKPKPYLNRIDFRIFGDDASAVAALQSGEVDMLDAVPLPDVPRLRGQLDLVTPQSWQYYLMNVNPNREPLKKKEVRQALQWAINRQALVDTALQGTGEPAVTPFGKHSAAYNATFANHYTFDPAKAQALLAQVGVSNPEIKIIASTQFGEFKRLAESIQADLSKVGFKVTIDLVQPADWSQRLEKADYDALMNFSGTPGYPTSMSTASAWRIKSNSVYGDNPPKQYVDAIQAASAAVEPAKQRAAFDAIQEALLDESWTIILASRQQVYGLQKRVKGFEAAGLRTQMLFDNAWLDR